MIVKPDSHGRILIQAETEFEQQWLESWLHYKQPIAFAHHDAQGHFDGLMVKTKDCEQVSSGNRS